MGLLDDLQSEVKKRKEEDLKQDAELRAQEEFYEAELRPVMLRAYDYFSEIVENLNIVAPDIRPNYPIDPLERDGITLGQNDYEFDFDNSKKPRQINIYCTCTLERPLEFHVPTKDAVLKYGDLLNSYGFPHHCKNHLDDLYNIRGGTFLLEGPLKVHIKIFAHPADRCIYLTFRNLEDQPDKRYKFSPDALDDEFLERVARVLIRQERKLVEVQVSDNVRDELRRHLEQEKLRNEEDLAQAYLQIAAEKLAKEEAKLVNRTKRAIAVSVDKVSKIIKDVK